MEQRISLKRGREDFENHFSDIPSQSTLPAYKMSKIGSWIVDFEDQDEFLPNRVQITFSGKHVDSTGKLSGRSVLETFHKIDFYNRLQELKNCYPRLDTRVGIKDEEIKFCFVGFKPGVCSTAREEMNIKNNLRSMLQRWLIQCNLTEVYSISANEEPNLYLCTPNQF